ncbi:hypothetical protein [Halobacterium jilantaiense]|uniref:Uncharacterized protein n=1 Tax=Halobacterium jilantaiense TaxID=355548 RepID=A0A1I0NI63_9EURY|nr:hypothetical protein [Halobacterium jilantaiense]SEW01130.1 hypothetical protein SAMN04487945_0897 [Halobacterium jilantaiense]
MPVLHEYSDSYPKSGYYVNVNWSAPHPYPLQTPAITARIYRSLGFQPGDAVPNELTSRLFNAGLHWTGSTGTGDPAKQTDLNPIDDTDIPELDSESLDHVYYILNEAPNHADIDELNPSAVDDLKSELSSLRPNSNPDSDSLSERTVTALDDLRDDQSVSREQAEELRAACSHPPTFDSSVYEFVRNHPITPRAFEVNKHGSPSFTFSTTDVTWNLADCRPDSLSFDWPVTIAPGTDREFGLRVTNDELVRVVHDGHHLSTQQATDLITILPCLLWTLHLVDDYSLSDRWTITDVKAKLPEPQREWLDDQIRASLSALGQEPNKTDGIIVDRPDQYLGRIRTRDKSTVCMAVNALPDDAEVGDTASFDVDHRYDTYYATNITLSEKAPNTGREIEISTGDETHSFRLPSSSTPEPKRKLAATLSTAIETVGPTAALKTDVFQRFITDIEINDPDIRDRLLQRLLAGTPFHPGTFPELVTNLNAHHRLPDKPLSFHLLPIAACTAVFYDAIDTQAILDECDNQGDTTILYHRDGNTVLVGNELLWHGIANALQTIPDPLKAAIGAESLHHARFVPRTIAALSEQQFYRTISRPFVEDILQAGIQKSGLNALYLPDNEVEESDNILKEIKPDFMQGEN